jgi:hypothetical protein
MNIHTDKTQLYMTGDTEQIEATREQTNAIAQELKILKALPKTEEQYV